MTDREGTIREIACNAADHAAWNYGQALPLSERLALWEQYYDATLAALLVFDELVQNHAQQRELNASSN